MQIGELSNADDDDDVDYVNNNYGKDDHEDENLKKDNPDKDDKKLSLNHICMFVFF